MTSDPQRSLLGLPGHDADDPDLPGPFAVGKWARDYQRHLRTRPRILLLGEVFNLRRARASTYFELRDAEGAAPCAIWNSDLEKLKLPDDALRDGVEVVIGGGPDYYPGSKTASPGFSFRVTHIRLAGEGDLLAQLDASRRRLAADGLLEPQKALPRPAIPRTIGVVSARNSAACADLLAALERRGWRGTIVWADAPVQDRRASGAIGVALRGLAERSEIEVAVVCRGGGSLTDLWAFCDERLCRTVAMLRVPVISAVGHQSDRTLIDEVAAVSCSTPTHAAEELVRLDLGPARTGLRALTATAASAGSEAVARRAAQLAEHSRAPQRTLREERRRLRQILREVRASAARGSGERMRLAERHALVVSRKAGAFAAADAAARGQLRRATRILDTRATATAGEYRRLRAGARTLDQRPAAALATAARRVDELARTRDAHDPQRTLERGYALVADRDGEPVTSAATARERGRIVVRFADDDVNARIEEEDGSSRPEEPP